ncbi:hypothetical protein AB4Z43_04245 [Mesorhizobium sp. 2RAF45]
MRLIKTFMAAATALAVTALVAPTFAADDPGPAAYAQALKGKRVMLVPLAMGFDLAQGWAHYLKKEVEALGRHLRDARSELGGRRRCAGDHRCHLVRYDIRQGGFAAG